MLQEGSTNVDSEVEQAGTPGPTIRVRRYDLPDEPLPRWWYDGNPVLSHGVNALNALFPLGERFFVRSVRHYLDQIDDPVLREQVRRFAAQETHHGRAHDQAIAVLEVQGYEIQRFLAWYERVAYGFVERVAPPRLRLSVTVALEHLTATLAREALTEGFLDRAHPQIADLLRWHACEEIEHKAVAFEVYRRTGGGYVLRITGMALAVSLLLFFWSVGARHLLAQEQLSASQLAHWRRKLREQGLSRTRLLRTVFGDYLRPSFHPDDDTSDRVLARDYLASIGRLTS